MGDGFQLAHPWWLLLLPLWLLLVRRHRDPTWLWASVAVPPTFRTRLMELLPWGRLLALGLITVALARPQRLHHLEVIQGEGIDIALVMDVSESMLAEDFRPNRLELSRQQAIAFVAGRKADRLSLTLFAGEAFSPVPLTTDHRMLISHLASLDHGILRDGTAIGDGLATAVNRLKASASRSKVIILLTDGENNAGYIQPMVAAAMAATLGIRVYTIGLQSAAAPGRVDEGLLQQMAEQTGGRFFRATDEDALRQIYTAINTLEKSPFEVMINRQTKELYRAWALAAFILIVLEQLLRITVLRTLL